MTGADRSEIANLVNGLRTSCTASLGNLRGTVSGPDEKAARAAFVSFSQDMAELVSDGTALEASK